MDLEQQEPLKLTKRTLVVDQLDDDTYCCCYQNINARQQLLPMLRAAERQFRIKLNREALNPPANSVSPTEKGE